MRRAVRKSTRRRVGALAVLALAAGCAAAEAPQPGGSEKSPPGPGAPGEPCEPTALNAGGIAGSSGVTGHCDDIDDPARPVWRSGPARWPQFSVADHGARPDDEGCDTAGFQRAVDVACAAGGGRVAAPAGRYRICRAETQAGPAEWGVLVACDNVHLRGESIERTLLVGEPGLRPTNSLTMFRFLHAARVSMARATIDGSYDDVGKMGWGNGIRGEGVREAHFAAMRITDHFNHNISLKPSTRPSDDNTIRELVTERGRQTNIILFSKAAEFGELRNRRNRILDCTATGSQVHYGLEVRYSDETEVRGGLYSGNTNGGINIEEGSRGTRIVGATMRENAGNGLKITGNLGRVPGTTCEGCVIEANGEDGVRNVAGDDLVLRDCRITRNRRHGYVDVPRPDDREAPASRTRFENCRISDNAEYGIVARGSGHVLVGGDVFGNGAGAGRAGIKTVGGAGDLRVEGTRFASQ